MRLYRTAFDMTPEAYADFRALMDADPEQTTEQEEDRLADHLAWLDGED